MRRWLLATGLALLMIVPLLVVSPLRHGYAQTGGGLPVGDEFNFNTFAAPFAPTCASSPVSLPCPDPQGPNTWNLNSASPGQLRIMSQFGTLLGTAAQGGNSARNLILQPVTNDFVATTKLTFPATIGSFSFLGQTAGIIVYQDSDNFIYVARTLNGGATQLHFVQESSGVPVTNAVTETGVFQNIVYLRVVKSGPIYQGFYSYSNAAGSFVPFTTQSVTPTVIATSTPGTSTATPGATATAVPPQVLNYIANYPSPQVGLFNFGGTNAAVASNLIPADFDWFRVGTDSTVPATTTPPTVTTTPVTPLPTSTASPISTSTPFPTSTPFLTSTPFPTTTVVPTATAAPTATSVPTATLVPTATPTPIPTPKPKKKYVLNFKTVSLWYHTVAQGTWDYLYIRANHSSVLGIWVTIKFPNGKTIAYYENTDPTGQWAKRFDIPKGVVTSLSREAVVTVQLWHGKTTSKTFLRFTLV